MYRNQWLELLLFFFSYGVNVYTQYVSENFFLLWILCVELLFLFLLFLLFNSQLCQMIIIKNIYKNLFY
jgi:hypothetical protein